MTKQPICQFQFSTWLWRCILALILFTFLPGCTNKPSLEEMESLISKARSEEFTRVVDFNKTNAYLDGNDYVAEVSYNLQFTKDYNEAMQILKKRKGGVIDTMQNIVEAGVLVTKYGRFNAGDKFPVKETIHFIKTEQGWRIKAPAS